MATGMGTRSTASIALPPGAAKAPAAALVLKMPGSPQSPRPSKHHHRQRAAALTANLRESCGLRALRRGTLEKVMACVVPAFQAGNIPRICPLMSVHPAFSRAQQFLDQLLTGAIASVMGTWPDQIRYSGQPLPLPWFTLKRASVQVSFPASHRVGHVHILCVELERLELAEVELEAASEPPPELQKARKPEEVSAPGLDTVPADAPVLEPGCPAPILPNLEPARCSPWAPGPAPEREPPEPPALTPIAGTMDSASPLTPTPTPTPDYLRAVPTKSPRRKEKRNILTFPARLVAKQLTMMDAGLFRVVQPYQCLGAIWSQRNEPGKEDQSSSVHATIRQFNRVVTCVITTCLGDPSTKARTRVKVLEHWIKVARECRTLGNFSSLQAILSALQSASVHRLKQTWGKVSRRSLGTFQKLCDQVNSLRTEPLPLPEKQRSGLASVMRNLCGVRPDPQERCVPFLGLYLTKLKRLDMAVPDSVLEEDMRLEQRKKKWNVLREIVDLQVAAENYAIKPKEQFWVWFRSLERLSEKECYILSCQLEPRNGHTSCPERSSRFRTFLRADGN